MQRQAHVDAIGIDVVVDATIRIAGEVDDHAAPGRLFIETRHRHDREDLPDCPDVRH
jgi:hypothetical protein